MCAYAEELFTPRAAHADEFAAAALNAIQSLPAGSRVLDIGCGTGDLIRRAQRPGFSFVGVDISRPNIETAKASGGAEFHCADFLQFDGGQFNVVFANSVLHLIDGPNTTVAAALSRTIQPHGLLVAAMPIDTAHNRLLAFQRRLWSAMPQRLDRWIGSAVSSILKDASVVERLVYPAAMETASWSPALVEGRADQIRRDPDEAGRAALDRHHGHIIVAHSLSRAAQAGADDTDKIARRHTPRRTAPRAPSGRQRRMRI